MKTCRLCLVDKPLEEFHRSGNSPDGRQYRCKTCASAAARQWAKDHPERYKQNLQRHRQTEHYRQNRARWRDANRDKVLAQRREWARANRAKIQSGEFTLRDTPEYRAARRADYARWRERDPKGVHRQAIWSMYRLTLDDWDAMVLAQEGRCAICNEPMLRPNVDHCHTGGQVRALLCSPCNTGLGSFRDDPERLAAAITYLRAHMPDT